MNTIEVTNWNGNVERMDFNQYVDAWSHARLTDLRALALRNDNDGAVEELEQMIERIDSLKVVLLAQDFTRLSSNDK